MALQDTREFLEDLLTRFDPSLDLSDGSRAQVELISPLLERLGPDPFDEDVEVFLRERVRQVFPDLSITEADGLSDTLISPMRVFLEPISREVKLIKLRSSLLNIGSLSDAEVDALLSNLFEPRRAGAYSSGVVRIYFSSPISVSATIANPVTSRGGLRFTPTVPQSITSEQMLLNPDGTEYYFDVNYTAEKQGTEYDIEAAEIISIASMPAATRVTNLRRFRGGAPREDSLSFAARVSSKQSDRTLTVERGIISELFDNFPSLRKLQVIGFNDPEMSRDVVKGGGLGPILANDSYGACFGIGVAVDDLDADTTSPLFQATANFVARIGSIGSEPTEYYLSLAYNDGADDVVVDAQIVEVVANDQVELDTEIPLSATTVFYAIRKKVLTLADIPGGITLPDNADGTISIAPDGVHIGGKTDVYVAGATDEASATITGLSDESPAARGSQASTNATDVVTIPGADWDPTEDIETLMTLVLEEGVDAGSYQIREITVAGLNIELRIDTALSGTQSNLNWKIVDDIDQELTEPKDIKVEGSDLLTVAGNANVTTSASTNFLDANVQIDDILRITNDENIGGDYTITAVGAVTLTVDPPPGRTVPGTEYMIFRASEGIETPVVRVTSMELLDSSGAPVGIKIPYRDPVLALSRGFQNEGRGFLYEGTVITGLVSTGFTGSLAVGGLTLDFDLRRPETTFEIVNQFSFMFSVGNKTAAQMVSEINADLLVSGFGIRATTITHAGLDYVALSAPSTLMLQFGAAGTANTLLGFSTDSTRLSSTARVRPMSPGSFYDAKILEGHRIEFLEGRNTGYARIIQSPTTGAGDNILLGDGPLGPSGTVGLYDQHNLNPDVGVRVRIGRPSLGTARVYFLDPTSAEFDYAETRASITKSNRTLEYQPDPENKRQLIPAPPLTALPSTGVTAPPGSFGGTLSDSSTNFQELGIAPGDLLDLLYVPITGNVAFPAPPADVLTSGLTLIVSLANNPYITVSFPTDMDRDEVVEYINDQVGEEIASLDGSNQLVLTSDAEIVIRDDSTALTVLGLNAAARNNIHPEAGTYVIIDVAATQLTLATETSVALATSDSQYRIHRYLQRISSTEMNVNTDESGLYFVDVEMVSLGPGDAFNLSIEDELEITGHRADGYRLRTENVVTSYSRAEKVYAEISRSILLVGSSDSPADYVQLSTQNVLVTYERSQLVDDVQSFCDSKSHRVVCEEILARHLLPHYVRTNWKYVGGEAEATMRKAIEDYLDTVDPDEQLEVSNVVKVLTARGAVSVYAVDPDSSTGRTAPLLVVIYHDLERRVRASIVRDFVETSRTQRFLADTLTLSRTSPGGIR